MKLTTEQMVRKAFCHGWKCADCPNKHCILANYRHIAFAARRFVRMEQAEKLKRIDKRYWQSWTTGNPKLPAHFGEVKGKRKMTNQQLHDGIMADCVKKIYK